MGVKGLSSFIKSNHEAVTDEVKLHDTKIVIDAQNLINVLLEKAADGERRDLYGGDLVQLGQYIGKFFDNLKQCNIEPIMVFDGAQTREDGKTKTREKLRRCQERFDRVYGVTQEQMPSGNQHILPTVAAMAYRSIILDKGVQIVQSPFEADLEVARLAIEHKCPAVSNDSDFILMDLPHGLILTDFLDLDRANAFVNPMTKKTSYLYITCRIFTQDKLAKFFTDFDKQTLPLLGVLAGNDFIDASEFYGFCERLPLRSLCDAQNITCRQFRRSHGYLQQRITKILHFLDGKSLNQAINLICQSVPKDRRQQLKESIKKSLAVYKIPTVDTFTEDFAAMLRDGFHHTYKKSKLSREELETKFQETIGVLVEWFKRCMESSLATYKILEAVNRNTIFIRPNMDDHSLQSAQQPFLKVLGVFISLTKTRNPDNRPCFIYDRVAHYYRRTTIHPRETIGDPPVSIDYLIYDIPQLPQEVCRNIILATFHCSLTCYVSSLPEYYEWFEHKRAEELLIFHILMDSLDCEKGQGLKREFRQAVWLCILYYTHKWGSDEVFKRKLLEEDATDSMDELLTLVQKRECDREPILTGRSRYNTRLVHQSTQIQSLIVAYNHLNSFLGDQFARVRAESWLNCCLIYNLTEAMLKRIRLPIAANVVFLRRYHHCSEEGRGDLSPRAAR